MWPPVEFTAAFPLEIWLRWYAAANRYFANIASSRSVFYALRAKGRHMTQFFHLTTYQSEAAMPAPTVHDSVLPCRHDSLQNRSWTGSLPALAGGASR